MIFINNRTHVAEIGIFKCGFQIQVERTRVSDHWKTVEMVAAGWGKRPREKVCNPLILLFFLSEAMVFASEAEQALLRLF